MLNLRRTGANAQGSLGLPISNIYKQVPDVIWSLGGDHTIVLPILRSLNKVYGPVSVIHFDAHLDTWDGYPGTVSEQSRITHGTFFYVANEEGLVSNSSIHAGIRCKLVVNEALIFIIICIEHI